MTVHGHMSRLFLRMDAIVIEAFMKNLSLMVEFSGVRLIIAMTHLSLGLFQTLK